MKTDVYSKKGGSHYATSSAKAKMNTEPNAVDGSTIAQAVGGAAKPEPSHKFKKAKSGKGRIEVGPLGLTFHGNVTREQFLDFVSNIGRVCHASARQPHVSRPQHAANTVPSGGAKGKRKPAAKRKR